MLNFLQKGNTRMNDSNERNTLQVSLYNLLSVTAKNGRPIQCWDLHVGAKLNLLGKSTTLMQGSQLTLDWLDRHTKRLTKIKVGDRDDAARAHSADGHPCTSSQACHPLHRTFGG